MHFLTFAQLCILLFFVELCFAQPPRGNGRGKEFLTPMPFEEQTGNICAEIPTRELDGQCTTIRDSSWGQARFAQFSYLSTSSSEVPTGRTLRSARDISNLVFDQRSSTVNSHGLNLLFVFFGQFLDHNLAATPLTDNESLDISVPASDRFLNAKELPFKRSVRRATDGGRSERPINTLTSAVDLDAVYGPNDLRASALQEFDSSGSATGKLRTSRGDMLPLNTGNFFNSPDASARFFLAGDHRSNEQPVLTALHTVFLREHNNLADAIKNAIPSLPGRLVFEYARLLNIAQFQKIVYEEFYPAIIGKPLPQYQGFDSTVDPTMSDIFAGAAFRVGHTMVSNEIPRRSADRSLSPIKTAEALFRAASTFSPSELNNLLRGSANAPAEEVDTLVVDALRNSLFQNVENEEGFDLMALNLQRGRDHALPKYNEIRKIFKIPPAQTFQDISSNPNTAARLSRAYNGNVKNVEAFPGLLAEDHERSSGLGRTMIAVWEREFQRLRDGDQFFYLRSSRFPSIVRRNLADWVRKLQSKGGITLKKIIERNTEIESDQLPEKIFRVRTSQIESTQVPVPSFGGDELCTKGVCCARSCGTCDGAGCESRPGGFQNCCGTAIRDSGRVCGRNTVAPCIEPPITGERPICMYSVCCPARCERCGGEGCGRRPGGPENCCGDKIKASGRVCGEEITSACVIPPSIREQPTCVRDVCCPSSCESCDGQGCGLRRGGPENCCGDRIRASGRVCSTEITAACVIPAFTRERPICMYSVCCPARCGKCGGQGCGLRPGGPENCCGDRIKASGRVCSKKITSACKI